MDTPNQVSTTFGVEINKGDVAEQNKMHFV
jgi:hypothetical protein